MNDRIRREIDNAAQEEWWGDEDRFKAEIDDGLEMEFAQLAKSLQGFSKKEFDKEQFDKILKYNEMMYRRIFCDDDT